MRVEHDFNFPPSVVEKHLRVPNEYSKQMKYCNYFTPSQFIILSVGHLKILAGASENQNRSFGFGDDRMNLIS